MKIVLDTNVLIAAFATQGLCHALFELCVDQHEIILSPDIMQEMQAALEKKLRIPQDTVRRIATYLQEHARIRQVRAPYPRLSRDASDDHVLALAEQSGAQYIITGDEDLLILSRHEGISIVRPRDFWQIVKNEQQDKA
jgi:putative PIN family toxin of toxin-antitoxin system